MKRFCVIGLIGISLWSVYSVYTWINSVTNRNDSAVSSEPLDSPGVIEFGSILAGVNHEVEVKLSNPTDHEIDIVNVKTSCGCANVLPPVFTIKPQSHRVVTARLNFKAGELAIGHKDVRANLLFKTRAEGTVHVLLKGTVETPFVMSPREVSFNWDIHKILKSDEIKPVEVQLETRGELSHIECGKHEGFECSVIDQTAHSATISIDPGDLVATIKTEKFAGTNQIIELPVQVSLAGSEGKKHNGSINVKLRVHDGITVRPSIITLSNAHMVETTTVDGGPLADFRVSILGVSGDSIRCAMKSPDSTNVFVVSSTGTTTASSVEWVDLQCTCEPDFQWVHRVQVNLVGD